MQPGVTTAVERLTWSEVCERYPKKWVVVVETERTDDTCDPFDSAVVVSHHDRRAEVSPSVKAAFLTHRVVGAYWTGRIRISPATRIAMR